MTQTQILFVEDDLSLQKSIAYILEKEGFAVHCCLNGENALELAHTLKPDLVLLDVMLPGLDGFAVCRQLKNDPRCSGMLIVMLTGKALLEDVIRGLEGFADDYITKPFEPRLLIARLHAVLRRQLHTRGPIGIHMEFAGLKIIPAAREVYVHEQKIALTKTEFDILQLLATRPNQVFSRAQILDHIRSDAYPTGERAIDFQMTGLRKKLLAAGAYIQTVRGVGYKFLP